MTDTAHANSTLAGVLRRRWVDIVFFAWIGLLVASPAL